MKGSEQRFRFRPALRSFPFAVLGVGGLLLVLAALDLVGGARTFALACGVAGPLLALAYLLAPAWRYLVVVDDDALEVRRGAARRFRLTWDEIARVVCVRAQKVCFVNGGEPTRSLLVPGPGAPAPYRIERREVLYEWIVAHTPAGKIEERESLEAKV